MVLAYLLITTKSGNELNVAQELLNYKEIDNLHIVHGEYDIIAVVKSPNQLKLKELINEKLSKINGLDKITTLIAADQTKETDNVFKRKV